MGQPAFGSTRILGELRKLGIKISRQTVKVILKENNIDPSPERGHGTWDQFLRSHAETLWQCDFVTKPMWTPKGLVDLYFLVFLHLGTRRCWISPCTASPDSAWICQQARNFLCEADDMGIPPKVVLRDNDAKYSHQFDAVLESAGAVVTRNTVRSPNLRAHVERFIQTMKVECLDRFVMVAERHLNYVNRTWMRHYNEERPHESCGHLPPDYETPETVVSVQMRDILCTTRLGGLLNSYSRRAA